MRNCFVMQPFDKGEFDKRYDDVFAPAVKNAGLEPYRVDRDLSVSIPIRIYREGTCSGVPDTQGVRESSRHRYGTRLRNN